MRLRLRKAQKPRYDYRNRWPTQQTLVESINTDHYDSRPLTQKRARALKNLTFPLKWATDKIEKLQTAIHHRASSIEAKFEREWAGSSTPSTIAFGDVMGKHSNAKMWGSKHPYDTGLSDNQSQSQPLETYSRSGISVSATRALKWKKKKGEKKHHGLRAKKPRNHRKPTPAPETFRQTRAASTEDEATNGRATKPWNYRRNKQRDRGQREDETRPSVTEVWESRPGSLSSYGILPKPKNVKFRERVRASLSVPRSSTEPGSPILLKNNSARPIPSERGIYNNGPNQQMRSITPLKMGHASEAQVESDDPVDKVRRRKKARKSWKSVKDRRASAYPFPRDSSEETSPSRERSVSPKGTRKHTMAPTNFQHRRKKSDGQDNINEQRDQEQRQDEDAVTPETGRKRWSIPRVMRKLPSMDTSMSRRHSSTNTETRMRESEAHKEHKPTFNKQFQQIAKLVAQPFSAFTKRAPSATQHDEETNDTKSRVTAKQGLDGQVSKIQSPADSRWRLPFNKPRLDKKMDTIPTKDAAVCPTCGHKVTSTRNRLSSYLIF